MDKKQLDNERIRIRNELEQLLDDIHSIHERYEDSSFSKYDEKATESFELEKKIALEKNLRDNLTEVEHALKKFEEGTYGICGMCGKPIAPEQLEVRPYTALCVECKDGPVKNGHLP